MRALTVHQPFASLIMAGAKPFEFRNRRPPAALIGQRIVIHASAQKIRQPFAADLFVAVRDQALSSIITATLDPAKALPVLGRAWEPAGEPLPMSAGVGTVIIGEPRRATEVAEDPGYLLADDEQDFWAWPMLDIERWTVPVAQAGAQGFWTWPPCGRCMGTGYSDYAGFAQDLCAHGEPQLSGVAESATKMPRSSPNVVATNEQR